MKGLLGKKLGMLSIFDANNMNIPVTVINAGPCFVTQKKSTEKDGYFALQLGFEDKRDKVVRKPQTSFFKKLNMKPKRFLHELRVTEEEFNKYNVGDEIKTDIFAENEFIDVTGTSIGIGFTGVMKRYNFHGIPATHGSHEFFRHTGSIGCNTNPAHTFKGKKMPGHEGNKKVTVQNLKIVKIDAEDNLLFVQGAVPGHENGFVIVKQAVKKTKNL